MASKMVNAVLVAVCGMLCGTLLQGCSSASILHHLCSMSTGSLFDDMRAEIMEAAAEHCESMLEEAGGAEETADARRRRLQSTEEACEQLAAQEVDEELAAERANMTDECVEQYANLSASDLLDTDSIQEMIEEFMNSSEAHLDSFKEHAEAAAEAASEHASSLADAASEHMENLTSRLYEKRRNRVVRPAGYYAKYARVGASKSRRPLVAAGLAAVAAFTAVGAFALRRRGAHARAAGMAAADEEGMLPQAEE